MSKLERLMNLTAALLETRRPLSADEVRQRVPGYPEATPSFRRAFERDKDDLREMGVPVVLAPIEGTDPPQDGYLIPKDQYELRDPGLEADELAALHLAASAVRLQGGAGADALWKLGGVVADQDDPGQVAALPADPNLVPLFTGVVERRPATFRYRGEERQVDPYRLDFLRGHWYLSAFDHLRGEERNFRLDRIDGDVAFGPAGAFDRPSPAVPGLRLHPWQLGEGAPDRARVLVDADQAPSAVHHVGDEAVVERGADGSVVLELAVTNRAAFRSFVLGFLEHAEVLGPAELRDDVAAWLQELAS